MTNKANQFAAGVYAAMVTPRRQKSREADTARLLEYVDAVTRAGVNGLVLFGSTGEFVHFDVEERMRVVALAVKRSRIPVLVNVSHSTLSGACDLAESAMASGAAGVLLMPPYFYRYNEGQVLAFYQEFVRFAGDGIPLYLYNLPFFTTGISANLAERLLESGAVAGIKDSSGDPGLFESLLRMRERIPFQLLAGNESIYQRAFECGADGAVSGVAAAIPELVVALCRCLMNPASGDSESLNRQLQEFVSWIERFPATFGIRQAAALRGWISDHPAVPVDAETAALADTYRAWLAGWLPAVLKTSALQRSPAPIPR